MISYVLMCFGRKLSIMCFEKDLNYCLKVAIFQQKQVNGVHETI